MKILGLVLKLFSMAVMACAVFIYTGVLALSQFGVGQGLARVWSINAFFCAASFIALALYFNFPWIAIAIGWAEIMAIYLGLLPLDDKSFEGYLFQYWPSFAYLVGAHLGEVGHFLWKKWERAAGPRVAETRL